MLIIKVNIGTILQFKNAFFVHEMGQQGIVEKDRFLHPKIPTICTTKWIW